MPSFRLSTRYDRVVSQLVGEFVVQAPARHLSGLSQPPQPPRACTATLQVFAPGRDVSWIKQARAVSLELHDFFAGGSRCLCSLVYCQQLWAPKHNPAAPSLALDNLHARISGHLPAVGPLVLPFTAANRSFALPPDYFGLKRGEVSARVDAAFSPTGFTPVSDNEHIIYLNQELQVRFGWFVRRLRALG